MIPSLCFVGHSHVPAIYYEGLILKTAPAVFLAACLVWALARLGPLAVHR